MTIGAAKPFGTSRAYSTEQCTELHFVGTENVFVYYRYLKEARSAPARYVHGSVVRPVDGIFIAQLNCRRIAMLSPSKG
jgi:hypothetical protein